MKRVTHYLCQCEEGIFPDVAIPTLIGDCFSFARNDIILKIYLLDNLQMHESFRFPNAINRVQFFRNEI